MNTETDNNEKPFDLAIAGELNLDLILYGLPLTMPTERDLLASDFKITLGSSSAIVAHNAAALGLRVRFASLVGDDEFGQIAVERLRRAGVEISGVIVDGSVSTGVTVLLPHGVERHSLTFLGSIAALTIQHLNLKSLAQARHFHLSSLYLQTSLHSGLVELLQFLKKSGLSISLDTNDDPDNTWGQPLYDLLPFVDVFLPNESEICRMAGGVSLERAIQEFGDKVPTLIVKRGPMGCRVKQGDQITDVPGLTVTPVDTIGAGDSFNAGFLCAYLRGEDIVVCARAGNISGALSTQASGGTEAFWDKTLRESFLRKHTPLA